MSRYSLRPYVSVYRDPGSVQINALQRQRFQQAFNADDALAGAVDQMQAADFAGDQDLKNQLEQSTRQQLMDRAGRGDYETMMMDVAKSARVFDQQYQPIKKNYEAYTSYVNDLKNNEGIDAETRALALQRSRHEYSGLQRNEDGTIDQSSFFSGFNVVDDVDVQAMMSEQMKDVAVRKYGNEGKVLSKDGNFYITNGIDIEEISPERVASVFNNIMQDPDVAAAFQQKGELRTFHLSDEEIRSRISTTLYGDENNPDSKGLIEQRQEAIDSGNDKEAQRLDNIIKEQERLLNDTGSGEDLTEQRRTYLKNSVIQQDINRELQTSYDKFVFKNVDQNNAIEYSQKWTADYEFVLNNSTPNLFKRTEVNQIQDIAGKTSADINSFITLNSDTLNKTVQDAQTLAAPFLTGGRQLTEQDIISNNVPEDLREDPTFQEMRSKVMATRKQIVIQQNRLQRAAEESGAIANVDKYLTKDYGGITGQEVLDIVRKTTGNQDMALADAIIFLRKTQLGDVAASPGVGGPGGMPASPGFEGASDEERAMGERILNELKGKVSDISLITGEGLGVNSLSQNVLDGNRDYTKTINKWLKDNSTITAGSLASNNMPGMNAKEVVKNTKYVKDFFKSTPLDKSFNIYWDGKQQRGTGTVASMVEELGWDSDEIQVKNVLFHTTPFLGEPTLQLTVTGKKGGKVVSKEIVLPYSNIRNKQMDQYFNSPGYLLQMEMNLHKHTGASSADMAIYGPDGKETGLATVDFSKGSDKVTLFDPTKGKNVTYRVDSPEFTTFVNDAAKLGYEIRTKL